MLTIYPFLSQNVLHYDRTALHIKKHEDKFCSNFKLNNAINVCKVQRPKFLMFRFAHGS